MGRRSSRASIEWTGSSPRRPTDARSPASTDDPDHTGTFARPSRSPQPRCDCRSCRLPRALGKRHRENVDDMAFVRAGCGCGDARPAGWSCSASTRTRRHSSRSSGPVRIHEYSIDGSPPTNGWPTMSRHTYSVMSASCSTSGTRAFTNFVGPATSARCTISKPRSGTPLTRVSGPWA